MAENPDKKATSTAQEVQADGIDKKATSNAQEVQADYHEPFAHPMATAVPNMGGEVISHPNEKAPFDDTLSVHSLKDDDDAETEDITNTFVPFPRLKGVAEEPNPLTTRAVVVGLILGSLVNASNVYLGMNVCHPNLRQPLNISRSQDWLHIRC